MMQNKIILEKSDCFELEPGIIENDIRVDAILDENDIIAIKEANKKISQDKAYGLLLVSGESSSVTKEGREVSASEKHRGKNIATAMVIHSLAQKIIGNFYLSVNKPVIPTHLFNDKKKALEWLREKVANNLADTENKSKYRMW